MRLVHVESPTNPLCRVLDLRALAEAVHARGALLSVDATFLPPPFQRPLEAGVDLVLHSATKFLGGHSDVLGGVVSARHELLEAIEAFRRRTGGVPGPDAAWLLARSLPTLELRVQHQCAAAQRLAAFLDRLRARGSVVVRVHYTGLAEHPDHGTARTSLGAFGSLLAFEVPGGLAGAMRVTDRFQTIARAVSLGGVETVASLPAHSSHAYMTVEEREAAGIPDGLLRLSVGLEPPEALEADLARALGG